MRTHVVAILSTLLWIGVAHAATQEATNPSSAGNWAGQSSAGQIGGHSVYLVWLDDTGTYGIGAYREVEGTYIGTSHSTAAPIATPNIDTIAAAGIRFTRAHTDSSCNPTKCSALSGMRSTRTLCTNTIGLSNENVILPEAVGSAYAFNKMDVGCTNPGFGAACSSSTSVIERGWDYYYGTLGLAIGNYFNVQVREQQVSPEIDTGPTDTAPAYATDNVVNGVLAYQDSHPGQALWWVHPNANHGPYHVYSDGSPYGDSTNCTGTPYYGDECMTDLVETTDTKLQSIFSTIDLSKDYLIIVGDDGFEAAFSQTLPWNPRWNQLGKGWKQDAGTLVPLIIAGPGIPAGTVSDKLVATEDLYPTIIELMGRTVPTGLDDGGSRQIVIDGESLVPMLTGGAAPTRRFSIVGHGNGWAIRDDRTPYMVLHQDPDDYLFMGPNEIAPNDDGGLLTFATTGADFGDGTGYNGNDVITRPTGNWRDKAWSPGQTVTVASATTGANDGTYEILRVNDGADLEVPAGSFTADTGDTTATFDMSDDKITAGTVYDYMYPLLAAQGRGLLHNMPCHDGSDGWLSFVCEGFEDAFSAGCVADTTVTAVVGTVDCANTSDSPSPLAGAQTGYLANNATMKWQEIESFCTATDDCLVDALVYTAASAGTDKTLFRMMEEDGSTPICDVVINGTGGTVRVEAQGTAGTDVADPFNFSAAYWIRLEWIQSTHTCNLYTDAAASSAGSTLRATAAAGTPSDTTVGEFWAIEPGVGVVGTWVDDVSISTSDVPPASWSKEVEGLGFDVAEDFESGDDCTTLGLTDSTGSSAETDCADTTNCPDGDQCFRSDDETNLWYYDAIACSGLAGDTCEIEVEFTTPAISDGGAIFTVSDSAGATPIFDVLELTPGGHALRIDNLIETDSTGLFLARSTHYRVRIHLIEDGTDDRMRVWIDEAVGTDRSVWTEWYAAEYGPSDESTMNPSELWLGARANGSEVSIDNLRSRVIGGRDVPVPFDVASCGNNIKESGELCDGTDLDSNTCASVQGVGYTGTLACAGTCDAWDVSSCVAPVVLNRGYNSRAFGMDTNQDGVVDGTDARDYCDATIPVATLDFGGHEDPDGDGTNEDIYYVDCDTGTDTAGCGLDGATPCETIQYAMNAAGGATGTGGVQNDIICFAGTCDEENLHFTGSGGTGVTTVTATGDELDDWEYSDDPQILMGWDKDNDDAYPPYDVDDTAILRGSVGSYQKAFDFCQPASPQGACTLTNRNHIELAHFSADDYGYDTAANLESGFYFVSDGQTHTNIHDLELDGINRAMAPSQGANGHNASVITLLYKLRFGDNYYTFHNNEVIGLGAYGWRGSNPTGQYYRIVNNTFDYEGENDGKGPQLTKFWGGMEFIDLRANIIDSKLADWTDPNVVDAGEGFGLAQCTQDVQVIDNETYNLAFFAVLQGYDSTCTTQQLDTVLIADNSATVTLDTFPASTSGAEFVQISGQDGGSNEGTVGSLTVRDNTSTCSLECTAAIRIPDTNTAGTARTWNFTGNTFDISDWSSYARVGGITHEATTDNGNITLNLSGNNLTVPSGGDFILFRSDLNAGSSAFNAGTNCYAPTGAATPFTMDDVAYSFANWIVGGSGAFEAATSVNQASCP